MALRPRFNVLSLCSGIGGLDLGVKLAVPASRCVCYVEGEAYAAAVLVSRMADQTMDEAPIWSDVRTFDGRPWSGAVDCVIGGYPCQPMSMAGKQLGSDDERWLWPDVYRIVREVGPSWCFFENVAAHLSLGFEQVHDDLRDLGYRVAAGIFTASEVGGSHQRERLFILANSEGGGGSELPFGADAEGALVGGGTSSDCGAGLRDTPPGVVFPGGADSAGREDILGPANTAFPPRPDSEDWRRCSVVPIDRGVPRVDDGSPTRVDRHRACGNGVVPLVAAVAWRNLEAALGFP